MNLFPPNAEIGQLATMLLGGRDRYAALPQLLAYLMLALSVAGLARRVALSVKEAAFAACAFATLPIVVDPSHGTGEASLVPAMAKAAVTAGADGLLIEVHPAPEQALCDGKQALRPADFATLMAELKRLVPLCGRQLARRGQVSQHQGAREAPTIDSFDDEVIAP